MAVQTVFKRYELKYLLTLEQKRRLLAASEPFLRPDCYGKTCVCNLYFDTDSFLLARRSIEKPPYKEKLRLRSYGRARADGTVFVELKRKYRHEVYKRRIALPEREAMRALSGDAPVGDTQIAREIEYFLCHYGTLAPVVFLSYERQAYCDAAGGDLRVTFDEAILCRREQLSLCSEAYGTPLLPEGQVLMEVKCSGGLPLWLTAFLSREKIYKASFSKYGTAYKTLIFPQCQTQFHT